MFWLEALQYAHISGRERHFCCHFRQCSPSRRPLRCTHRDLSDKYVMTLLTFCQQGTHQNDTALTSERQVRTSGAWTGINAIIVNIDIDPFAIRPHPPIRAHTHQAQPNPASVRPKKS